MTPDPHAAAGRARRRLRRRPPVWRAAAWGETPRRSAGLAGGARRVHTSWRRQARPRPPPVSAAAEPAIGAAALKARGSIGDRGFLDAPPSSVAGAGHVGAGRVAGTARLLTEGRSPSAPGAQKRLPVAVAAAPETRVSRPPAVRATTDKPACCRAACGQRPAVPTACVRPHPHAPWVCTWLSGAEPPAWPPPLGTTAGRAAHTPQHGPCHRSGQRGGPGSFPELGGGPQ